MRREDIQTKVDQLPTAEEVYEECKRRLELEVSVCPGSELEIATAIVVLKRRAQIYGADAIPLEVKLCPSNPRLGWRRAAMAFIEENKRLRIAGKPIDTRPISAQVQTALESAAQALGKEELG